MHGGRRTPWGRRGPPASSSPNRPTWGCRQTSPPRARSRLLWTAWPRRRRTPPSHLSPSPRQLAPARFPERRPPTSPLRPLWRPERTRCTRERTRGPRTYQAERFATRPPRDPTRAVGGVPSGPCTRNPLCFSSEAASADCGPSNPIAEAEADARCPPRGDVPALDGTHPPRRAADEPTPGARRSSASPTSRKTGAHPCHAAHPRSDAGRMRHHRARARPAVRVPCRPIAAPFDSRQMRVDSRQMCIPCPQPLPLLVNVTISSQNGTPSRTGHHPIPTPKGSFFTGEQQKQPFFDRGCRFFGRGLRTNYAAGTCPVARICSSAASSSTGTPRLSALVSLEPALGPATR